MITTTATLGPGVATAAGTVQGEVALRMLERGDSASVLAVFAGMSPRSRELRFLGPKPRLTELDLRSLTAVDQDDHVAILAATTHDRQPIGIARFVRDRNAPDSAEVAVEVADAWQRLGVGSMLLRALVRRALEVGVERFTMLVSLDNMVVLSMLSRHPAGPSRIRVDSGTAEYAVALKGELAC